MTWSRCYRHAHLLRPLSCCSCSLTLSIDPTKQIELLQDLSDISSRNALNATVALPLLDQEMLLFMPRCEDIGTCKLRLARDLIESCLCLTRVLVGHIDNVVWKVLFVDQLERDNLAVPGKHLAEGQL